MLRMGNVAIVFLITLVFEAMRSMEPFRCPPPLTAIDDCNRRTDWSLVHYLEFNMQVLNAAEIDHVSGAGDGGAAVGGLAGGVAGHMYGGIAGAAVGSLLGPAGAMGGYVIGRQLGGYFGGAAGSWMGSRIQNIWNSF